MLSRLIHANNPDFAALLLRVALGFVFFAHGYQKLQNIAPTLAFFESIGFPAVIGYLVILIEFVGGLLMILGFFTKQVAWLFAAIMVGAIATVKGKVGFIGGYELDFVLLLASLALIHIPVGKWTVARIFGR